MESEKSQIQNPWKRDWLILGIATLIIPASFLLALPFGREYGLIPFAFVIVDMLYFSIALLDIERLKISIIFRILIMLLFFPILKFFVITQVCYPMYYQSYYILEDGNIIHMLYFLLPPILYFLITSRNLELFIRLRREEEGGAFDLLNSILIFLVLFFLFCFIMPAICLA